MSSLKSILKKIRTFFARKKTCFVRTPLHKKKSFWKTSIQKIQQGGLPSRLQLNTRKLLQKITTRIAIFKNTNNHLTLKYFFTRTSLGVLFFLFVFTVSLAYMGEFSEKNQATQYSTNMFSPPESEKNIKIPPQGIILNFPKIKNIAEGLAIPFEKNNELIYIQKIFARVSTQKKMSIVFLFSHSPQQSKSIFLASPLPWKTQNGTMYSDTKTIQNLLIDKIAIQNDEFFANKESLKNISPFLKKYFPRAKIIPLSVRNDISPEGMIEISRYLKNSLSQDSLLLLNTNFSNFEEKNVQKLHNTTTKLVLQGFDIQKINRLNIEKKAELSFFVSFFNEKESIFLENCDIQGSKDFYSGCYFSSSEFQKKYGEHVEEKYGVSLISFGDLMLDRAVRYKIQDTYPEYPFEKMKKMYSGVDMTLANLEGGFTDFTAKKRGSRTMQFTFDPKLIPYLKNFGFTHFSQANNHSQDYGRKGFTQTQKYLEKNELHYFGSYFNETNLSHIEEIRGQKIAFVGYHQLIQENYNEVIKEIKKMREETDKVIVVAHWGHEYKRYPSSPQKREAREFLDVGADVVLGHHPHVIQTLEVYKNKPIIYSQGNFVFDQWWSEETMHGLAVGIVFLPSSTEVFLFPTEIRKDLQVKLMPEEKKNQQLEWLAENSKVPEELREKIKKGRFVLP